MFSIQGFVDGTKTAMLTVSVSADRYLLKAEGEWRPVHDLRHGDAVLAVSHFGRHFSRVGTNTNLRSLETNASVDMLITEIIFVEVTRLTEQEIHDLGYKTRTEWELDWGSVLEQRTAWLIKVLAIDQKQVQ